ncbi:MAG TPA: geranylgeranylglyceryl/heptaprenylglyceryl phosphate synthase [Yeosuana sp.]
MTSIYTNIRASIKRQDRLFAVLIDPDKTSVNKISVFIDKINGSIATHIFVGGSIVDDNKTDTLIKEIKRFTQLPIVLFPGDITQISNKADALLFLSLISGRNPEYLIGKHIDSVIKLKDTNLEVIPTGYVLVENGKQTSVERVTHTTPISRDNIERIVNTAKAGELLGMKLIYLEAGSGALVPITGDIISSVKRELSIPLIVGGGIRTIGQLEDAYNSGADLVVIGTALEEDQSFFEQLKQER